MSKYGIFNGQVARQFRQDFAEHMRSFEEEHGVRVNIGNITYQQNEIRTKLTVRSNAVSDDAIAEKDFKRNAFYFGLNADDFGKSFKSRGETFTICGIKPRSRKYPILAKNARGKTYKFGHMYVQGAIKR